jgi:hypothetical protein
VQVAVALWPVVWQLFQRGKAIYQLLPSDCISALLGLVFCFCGGLFPTLFAAVEAARLTGWVVTHRAAMDLVEEGGKLLRESKKDDETDADGDGVADVLQLDNKALLLRKTKLVLTTCDPARLNAALSGLYMSWISVLATLRVRFARTITLALSVAEALYPPAMKVLAPTLVHLTPPEYCKWIPVVVGWMCKAVGVSLAWYIQRLFSALTSAVRGGLQCARALMRLAHTKGWASTRVWLGAPPPSLSRMECPY